MSRQCKWKWNKNKTRRVRVILIESNLLLQSKVKCINIQITYLNVSEPTTGARIENLSTAIKSELIFIR